MGILTWVLTYVQVNTYVCWQAYSTSNIVVALPYLTCAASMISYSERPIGLKVVSADTEYSAEYLPLNWSKIAPETAPIIGFYLATW